MKGTKQLIIILVLINMILGGIILADHFAVCKNKCFIPTLSQEDFAIIEGTCTITNGVIDATNIDYPEGFTKDNCVIISVGVAYKLSTALDYFESGASCFGARLGSSSIALSSFANVTSGPTGDRSYRIVLMKIS